MAPRTELHRLIHVPSTLLKVGLSLLLIIAASVLPYPVSAGSLPDPKTLPDLTSFESAVENGDASTIRGAYTTGLFALSVVQQPDTNAAYVSSIDNVLTQFSLASLYGNVGLLAHNYLSGQYFSQLMTGMRIQLVYGDGRIETFQVTQVYRYQAVSPSSVTSDFIDLDTHQQLSASELFIKVYEGPRHLTFQTCINQNGNGDWGRLFVIAEPELDPSGTNHVN